MTSTATRAIRIGHSPDPDDAFMFYAMTQGKIPLHGFLIEHQLQDIETLNQQAVAGALEVTAFSLHAYAYCAPHYRILTAGTSMGENYGPLVVSARPMTIEQLRGATIAIPGRLTTAALVLALCLGRVRTTILPFDQILAAVRRGDVDAGIVIHEGQLTYAGEGLHKVIDLGQWGMATTGLPLPLGVNGVRRDLPQETQQTLARLMRESIAYALAHREEALTYAQQYGRGLDRQRADQFVGMYVNHWTEECGPRGREAMALLLERAARAGIIPHPCRPEFVS